MGPIHLFALAAQHAQWASIRQAVVTGNIANANTPGYDALEVEPFSAVLDDTALIMARTTPAHFATESSSGSGDWDVKSTGAGVTLDQEMMKAADVNRAFSLDTSILRSFHRMLLTSVRSGV